MRDEDEVAGAGIVADLLEDCVDLRLPSGLVGSRRIERREIFRVAEGQFRRLAGAAIAAGQDPFGRSCTRGEQGSYLACLLLAAVGEVALRGAFLDVEIAGIRGARRHRIADQHDMLAVAQQRPPSFRRLRLDGEDKQKQGGEDTEHKASFFDSWI